MQTPAFNQGLLRFLQASPTPSHAVLQMQALLDQAGFVGLKAEDHWELKAGQGYYLIQSGRSILAFRLGQAALDQAGVRMIGAHTDSPCLKVKPLPDLQRHGVKQLGVEVYGGALLSTWFDRDLSLAGEVHYLNANDELCRALVNLIEPVGVIPSLAIHLNREANKGVEINPQNHLPMVWGCLPKGQEGLALRQLLAHHLLGEGYEVSEVVDYDLCLYDTQPPALTGWQQEMITSARLDNLLSCYLGVQALIQSEAGPATQLLACHDHEEVGSASAVGAEGPALENLLRRLAGDELVYQRLMAKSMLVSADNAHAIHPNYPERHDEKHGPQLNAGPVIKHNANQRYATSSETAALFAGFCREAGVPMQRFVVRSDMACGSTIGPISATQLGVRVVDVGVPQWGMHSIRETAGALDAWYLYRALLVFMQQPQLMIQPAVE